jgi:hypothetical protein
VPIGPIIFEASQVELFGVDRVDHNQIVGPGADPVRARRAANALLDAE